MTVDRDKYRELVSAGVSEGAARIIADSDNFIGPGDVPAAAQADFVDPATATPEAIATALIAAGLMAAS